MVKKIGMVIVGATLVVAHCLIGGTAFADAPNCVGCAMEDSMVFETYYPSPYGLYEELRGDKIIVGDTDGVRIQGEATLPPSGTLTFNPLSTDPSGNLYEGSLYYQGAIGATKGKFRFYDGSAWQDLGGGGDFWKPSTASGGTNDIYYTQSGNVGIGVGESDSLGAKLQVNVLGGKGLIIRSASVFTNSSTYVVPAGVNSLKITAYGAQGSSGGLGGMVQATVGVTPGETLYIYIGVGGGGGGYYSGGNGGGASDVRRGGMNLGNRIIVAGGGGGAGGTWPAAGSGGTGGGGTGGIGGIGGGTTGGAGGIGGTEGGGYGFTGGIGGGGGTDSTGGGGGSGNSGGTGGTGGSSGTGGTGGGGGGGTQRGGGGGGGGWYGGGGGSSGSYCGGGGGGGGSSYAAGSNISMQSGVQAGAGKVIIEAPSLSGIDNFTEWQNANGNALSVVDVNGNLALGASSANGYKLYVNGSAYVTSGAWTASDLRFKENILPLNNSLDKILNIQPVSFDWNKSGYPDMNFNPSRQIGLVAQEVEKQIPELVHTDSNGYKAVAYDKLTAVLVEAVKEQQAQIRNQQKKIEILELKLEELDNKK